jgi:transposase
VRKSSVGVRAWARLLGLEKTVVEAVELDSDGAIVVSVRPGYRQRDRCPHCRRRCPGYDQGDVLSDTLGGDGGGGQRHGAW